MTDFGSGAHLRGRRGKSNAGLWILITVLILALLGSCGVLFQRAEAQRQQQEIAMAEVRKARDAMVASRGTAVIDTRPKATGDAGVMERIAKEFLAQVSADNRALDAELKASGFTDVMEPRNLARDRGLVRSRALVKSAYAVIERYRALRAKRMEEFKAKIEAAPIGPRSRSDMMRGMEDSTLRMGDDFNRVWDIQIDALDEIDAALAVLQRVRWTVERGQVAFYSDADMAAYNNHILRVQALDREQRGLVQRQVTLQDQLAPLPGQGR